MFNITENMTEYLAYYLPRDWSEELKTKLQNNMNTAAERINYIAKNGFTMKADPSSGYNIDYNFANKRVEESVVHEVLNNDNYTPSDYPGSNGFHPIAKLLIDHHHNTANSSFDITTIHTQNGTFINPSEVLPYNPKYNWATNKIEENTEE